MATKSTPNLPASSRMQMPTSGTGKMMKEKTAMKGASKGATKKVMAMAKKGGK